MSIDIRISRQIKDLIIAKNKKTLQQTYLLVYILSQIPQVARQRKIINEKGKNFTNSNQEEIII